MQNPPRIAYITGESPDDINAWSGTLYFLLQGLEKAGCTVIKVGPGKPAFIHFIFSILNQVSLKIFGKRIDYRHSRIYSKAYGKIFSKRLKRQKFDLVLAIGGSEFIAYLKTDKPMILVVDRTIGGAVNYHPILKNLWQWSQQQSLATDELAMKRCALTIFASDWARDAAIKEYGLEPGKAITLPFGANLEKIPDASQIFERCTDTETLKLLFIGRDWETKGGQKALECFHALRSKGISAELHIVGCAIPEGADRNGVTEHGFLNKNIPEQLERISQLYLRSHIFILPTKFEAYGLVFVESAAFGLPSIAPKTGGVPTAMADGRGGILMNENATGEDYASEIIRLWQDKNLYRMQIEKTRNTFETGYNWDVWTGNFLNKTRTFYSPNNER